MWLCLSLNLDVPSLSLGCHVTDPLFVVIAVMGLTIFVVSHVPRSALQPRGQGDAGRPLISIFILNPFTPAQSQPLTVMETRRRMPLQDLPLEQFLTPGIAAGSKMPRNHKRPLSPSRTTPFNPAKRRVLDAEGVPLSNNAVKSSPSHPVPSTLSNVHTVTPTKSSRLGNRYNSFSDSCTACLKVMLGSFEIMGVPKEHCLLCRPTGVRLLTNFTLSRQSNHPPTRSQDTIPVLISSKTLNIVGAPRF